MSCTVRIPSPLRSYTSGAATVSAEGRSVSEVLESLERRFHGIRFRMVDEQAHIRPHIRLYVNLEAASTLDQPVRSGDTLHVICALSGG